MNAPAESSGLFSKLSDFEILEILRFFPVAGGKSFEKTLLSFGATCKRLHALALTPELWHDFDFSDYARSKAAVRSLCAAPVVAFCERLEINLGGMNIGTYAELVKAMPMLRELSISFCWCFGDLTTELSSAITNLRQLRTLRLAGKAVELLRTFRLEGSPVECLVLVNCNDFSHLLAGRVLPRITELHLALIDDCEALAVACPNLRKLEGCWEVAPFLAHCPFLEECNISLTSIPSESVDYDLLARSPCSQTLRRFSAGDVDCEELAKAAPNLVFVDLHDPKKVAGLAGLKKLEELRSSEFRANELNELGARARGMALKKIALDGRPSAALDLTRFFASPCCAQLEQLEINEGISPDSCVSGLVSQSGSLPLRSFKSAKCPRNLDALLSKCPALIVVNAAPVRPNSLPERRDCSCSDDDEEEIEWL